MKKKNIILFIVGMGVVIGLVLVAGNLYFQEQVATPIPVIPVEKIVSSESKPEIELPDLVLIGGSFSQYYERSNEECWITVELEVKNRGKDITTNFSIQALAYWSAGSCGIGTTKTVEGLKKGEKKFYRFSLPKLSRKIYPSHDEGESTTDTIKVKAKIDVDNKIIEKREDNNDITILQQCYYNRKI